MSTSRTTTGASSSGHGRDFGLDVARATAIVMVLVVHGITVAGLPFFSQFFTGVDLFFVLSGFLVGRIYFMASARDGFKLFDFWVARWWRTIPPYFAMLIWFWLFSRRLPFYYWLFAQNYVGIDGFVPSWSLCVEEHFYLALPIVATVITRLAGRRSFLYFLPSAFFVPLFLRLGTYWWYGAMPKDWELRSQYHCEGLILGVWLAYLDVDRREIFARLRRPALLLTPLAPILLTLYPLWPERPVVIDLLYPTLYALGYGSWVRALNGINEWRSSRLAPIAAKSLRALALISYSLYLTHTDISVWFRPHLHLLHRGVFKTLTVFAAEFAGGALFYFLFERPSIATRDWFRSRRQRAAAPLSQQVSTAGR